MPPHLLTDTLHTLQGFLPLCTGPQPSCTDYQRVVGPHLRHVLDHCDALLDGLRATPALVDYDRRARDTRTEQDRHHAEHRLRRVLLELQQLEGRDGSQPLSVRCATHPAREATPLPSSLARELQFLQSHAIHHQAVIAAAAQAAGWALPADFGMAPATLAQERSLAAD